MELGMQGYPSCKMVPAVVAALKSSGWGPVSKRSGVVPLCGLRRAGTCELMEVSVSPSFTLTRPLAVGSGEAGRAAAAVGRVPGASRHRAARRGSAARPRLLRLHRRGPRRAARPARLQRDLEVAGG